MICLSKYQLSSSPGLAGSHGGNSVGGVLSNVEKGEVLGGHCFLERINSILTLLGFVLEKWFKFRGIQCKFHIINDIDNGIINFEHNSDTSCLEMDVSEAASIRIRSVPFYKVNLSVFLKLSVIALLLVGSSASLMAARSWSSTTVGAQAENNTLGMSA